MQHKLLTFTQEKTTGIVGKANTEGIERHPDALRAIVKRIESVKTQIEQAKLESGVQVDELAKWSAGVEAQQATVDEETVKQSFKSIIKQVWKRRNAKKSWPREIETNNYSSSAHS